MEDRAQKINEERVRVDGKFENQTIRVHCELIEKQFEQARKEGGKAD